LGLRISSAADIYQFIQHLSNRITLSACFILLQHEYHPPNNFATAENRYQGMHQNCTLLKISSGTTHTGIWGKVWDSTG